MNTAAFRVRREGSSDRRAFDDAAREAMDDGVGRGALEERDESLERPRAHLAVWQRDGGEGRTQRLGDDAEVVDADDREVVRYREPAVEGRLVGAHRHLIVEADDRGRPLGAIEEHAGGLPAPDARRRAEGDVDRRDAVRRELAPHPLESADLGGRVVGDGDDRDPPVPRGRGGDAWRRRRWRPRRGRHSGRSRRSRHPRTRSGDPRARTAARRPGGTSSRRGIRRPDTPGAPRSAAARRRGRRASRRP